MTDRMLRWKGIDDRSRTDHASVRLGVDSMRAFGGAHSMTFTSAWELEVGPGWTTSALRVTTRGIGWSRDLALTRSASGEWSAETAESGESELPPPGLDAVTDLRDAVDCDLGLCPVTNTMPIRRLGLLDRIATPTRLVMAWVEVPSLRVLRSEQVYSSLVVDGAWRVRYESREGDFRADLAVDRDGLVVDYPGLTRRVATR